MLEICENQTIRGYQVHEVKVSLQSPNTGLLSVIGAHQQTLGALPGSTVVLIDGIVIHSTYSVCRNVYELRSAPVVLL